MRRIAPSMLEHPGVDRRRFLGITSIATATVLLGVTPSPRLGYAAALTKEQRDKLTPDDIIALMKKGNERSASARSRRTTISPSRRPPSVVNTPPRSS